MTALTTPSHVSSANDGLHPEAFHRRLRSRRSLFDLILSLIAGGLTILACIPLFSVLVMLFVRGGERLFGGDGLVATLTELPPGMLDTGGGFGNAIVGTVVMVVLASAIAIPFGILAAIFLAEYGENGWLASLVRNSAKVLTGLPSVLAGVFAYTVVVLVSGEPSAVAGGVALSVLMIPIVMLTAEESIRMVPRKMKEAAIGMGATQAQVTWKIVVPTALPGILTGVMLAVARAAGETAPLLLTAKLSYFSYAISGDRPFLHLWQETASLSMFIYDASKSPTENLQELAWSASLVLVLLVLIFNVGGQILSRGSRPKR